jgi:hypothetical protein
MMQQHIICFGYTHNAGCERERGQLVHPFDAISMVLLNAKVGQFQKKHQGELLPAPFVCNFCVYKMLNPSFTGVYIYTQDHYAQELDAWTTISLV